MWSMAFGLASAAINLYVAVGALSWASLYPQDISVKYGIIAIGLAWLM